MAHSACRKRSTDTSSQVTISRTTALRRTKQMLCEQWDLDSEPVSGKYLNSSNDGLGKMPNDLRALETPIETCYFKDVNATVAGHDLTAATTVGQLRDVIWKGVPDKHKQETKQ